MTHPNPNPSSNIDKSGNKYIRATTIIPVEWYEKIKEYMKKHGYYSIGELLRDLIREKIIEADEQ